MTNYIGPFTNQDGTPCLIDADNVGAFISVPALGGLYTGVFPVGVFASPFIITEDPSVFGSTLAGLGRTLSPQTQDDGTPVVFVVGNGPNGTVLKTVGTAPDLTAVYSVDSDPFIVLGDLATLAAALTPPPNPPPGSIPWRNTFDGYSSQLGGSLDFITTTDADRLIAPDELVWGNSLTWDQPGTTPRAWTMPSLAAMDAFIAGQNAGRALTLPGSGGKSLWVVNKSNAPLTLLDSADFHSPEGVGITIPPREKALVTWSHATDRIVDGVPTGPSSATWFADVSAGSPRAGDVWAGAIVNPGTGQPVPGYVFGDVASGAPYVPNSGAYTFTFKPVPPGWNYLVMTTADQPGQCVFSGNEGGPGVCVVFATEIGGPWLDATPFKFVVILVPPLGA